MKRIYQNVILGKNVIIEDFCIIGLPPKGYTEGQLKTVIGDNATIRSHTVIYAGNEIGPQFQSGHHVFIRESNRIGERVSIGTNSVIEHHIEIRDGARCHSNVFIPEYSLLEEGCWIGPNVVVTNANYPLSKRAKENLKGAQVRKNAKIGANSTLLPGVVIGENSLVGAGSVVTKDVPANVVVAGNPARYIKQIQDIPEYQLPPQRR